MNVARNLLDDLAIIGATIKPAGDRLILRAGHAAISPALVSRVRDAKADLLAALAPHQDRAALRSGKEKGVVGNNVKGRSFEAFIIEWLNHHPAPSSPGRCGWCGKADSSSAVVLPFGTEPGTHTWLHAQ